MSTPTTHKTDSAATGKPRRKRRPPWYLILLILAPIGLIVWLRTGERLEDGGMTNFFTTVLGLLSVSILLLWFTFARGFRLRTRLLTLTGLVLAIAGLLLAFRVDGFSGSMVPVVSPRWQERPAATYVQAPPPGRIVDLATTTPLDFPGFLGPNRSLHLPNIALARDWSAEPPHEIWRQPIGTGWSGFAVVNGVAVTQEERDDRQMVTAYDAATGAVLWVHGWTGGYTHPLGGPGPRSTPSVDDGLVYALGPHGRFVCLDGADGSLVWDTDLPEIFDMTDVEERSVVQYGRSNSPLVHGDVVIIPGGGTMGKGLTNLIAFDKKTGERVWTGSRHQISYSSPALARLGGVEQILIVNEDTVTGHDAATGRLLWQHPWPGRTNANATASQAIPIPPSSVFVSKGYGIGAALLDLEPSDDGKFAVVARWHQRRSLRTKHTNAIVRDGYVYGLSDGILECIDIETGTRVWKDGRYGHGQILGVGDLLLLLSEDGELMLIEPTPDTPNNVLGRVQAVEGLTWNNLALYGDLLLVRNGHEAVAYRLALARRP